MIQNILRQIIQICKISPRATIVELNSYSYIEKFPSQYSYWEGNFSSKQGFDPYILCKSGFATSFLVTILLYLRCVHRAVNSYRKMAIIMVACAFISLDHFDEYSLYREQWAATSDDVSW